MNPQCPHCHRPFPSWPLAKRHVKYCKSGKNPRKRMNEMLRVPKQNESESSGEGKTRTGQVGDSGLRHLLSLYFGTCRTLALFSLTFLWSCNVQSAYAQGTVSINFKADSTHPAVWKESLPVPHKTADKAFLIHAATTLLVTVGDVENSLYVIHHSEGATEGNPIFGRNPSRATYYGICIPVAALNSAFSFRYKREDDALAAAHYGKHKYAKWFLPVVINDAGHTAGIIGTIVSTHK